MEFVMLIVTRFFSIFKSLLGKIQEHILSVFSITIICVILVGWRLSRHELLTPAHGVGYFLGYIGVFCILLLMVYPLRKRVKRLAFMGSVKQWFTFHMFLGVVGPVFILYHANFHLGAMNSNIALISLLTVSGSGVIGRYVYTRIYQGLSGERLSLLELKKELEQKKEEVGGFFLQIPAVRAELAAFADMVLTLSKELSHSGGRLWSVRWRAYQVRRKTIQVAWGYLEKTAKDENWEPARIRQMRVEIKDRIQNFLGQTVKVAEFNFYERVFFLWHELHVPLVAILAGAILLHVIAVNRY